MAYPPASVYDATGTVPYGVVREKEDTGVYFTLIEGMIRRYGIPLAVYTDRHFVFKHHHPPSIEKDGLRRHN